MKKWMAAVLICVWYAPLWAEPLTTRDFAKGIVLDCDEEASIYRFTLPAFVYEILTRSDFGDIRVFNREGESLPFVLKRSDEGPVRNDAPPSVPLVFFPLDTKTSPKGDGGGVNVQIRTDKRGAVIDVNPAGSEGHRSTDQTVGAFLLDLSQVEKKPERLEFDWETRDKDRVIRVEIWESHDLAHWSLLLPSAVFAHIRFDGNTLKQDGVDLPVYTAPYLKVVIEENPDQLVLLRVTGQYRATRIQDEKPRQWTQLSGHLSGKDASEILYSASGHYPVDRIRIAFPRKNTLVRVTLKSKNEDQDQWTTRYNGLVYHLTARGLVFEKTLIECGRVSDNRWSLGIEPDIGGMSHALPGLELGWLPHTVMFVARGEAPYTLAFGSQRAGFPDDSMEPLLSGLDPDQAKYLLRDAVMKGTIELGGRKQLEKPVAPLPWKRLVFWAILLGGVGLCGAMAFSLYRQMITASKES